MAKVVGAPYRRSEPFVSASRIKKASLRIGHEVIDRPGLAVGSAQSESATSLIALQDKSALFCAEEYQHFLRHWRLSYLVKMMWSAHVDINILSVRQN